MRPYPKPARRKPKEPKPLRARRKAQMKLMDRDVDDLWSFFIRQRDGICRVERRDDPQPIRHVYGRSGVEAMHVHSRTYRRIRWDPRNGIGGCRRHHQYYTFAPLQWEDYIRHTRGNLWDVLRDIGLYGPLPDRNASWSELSKMLLEMGWSTSLASERRTGRVTFSRLSPSPLSGRSAKATAEPASPGFPRSPAP